jgi:hypothetical protein
MKKVAMLDVCIYYGACPPQMLCPDDLYFLMVTYETWVTSIDGYLGGDFDLYYCEFCDNSGCIYNTCCNIY